MHSSEIAAKLKVLALSILAIFAPIKPAIITVGVMVALDLITGVWAANKRKEPITSNGLKQTVMKLMVFQIALITGFLTEKYLTGDLVPITKIIAAFIGLVEYTSMLENLNEINGQPIFKSIIKKIGKDSEK